MLPDWVSNPGPLTYESGALPIALRGPAQLDRYIYTICIVHTDELRISRQAIYMRQRSGHAQFEFTYDRFSRDAVQKATLQQIL